VTAGLGPGTEYELPRIENVSFNGGVTFNFALSAPTLKNP